MKKKKTNLPSKMATLPLKNKEFLRAITNAQKPTALTIKRKFFTIRYTVRLDGSVGLEEIFQRIDRSYAILYKKK